jgi:lysophospholipase L1-like esterase
MGTVWTFGDSLTAEFDERYEWSGDYIKWKGYKPKVYANVISEKLNLDLINLGVGGNDNYSIFQSFCDVSDKIKNDDVVIFGWSSPIRFRLAMNEKKWKIILPKYIENNLNIDGITINTINEILLNRDSFMFVQEVNSWIKLIDYALKDITHVHWTTFDHRIDAHMIRNLDNIRKETNGLIDDGHFSEKGHIELSELLITYFSKGRTKKLI